MALDLTTRRGWGARTGRTGRPMGTVGRLVIHHFWRPDVPPTASRTTERAVMRGVEAFHAQKGWSAAPGYQVVVFDSARAYIGCGLGRRGVHTKGLNSVSIALCFGNDGDQAQPTDRAWETAYDLRQLMIERGDLTSQHRLSGHRDHAAKSCPGNRTYPHIERVRTAPTEPPPEEDEVLKPDSHEWDIRTYQATLRYWGTPNAPVTVPEATGLAVDGVWGEGTERAHIAVARDTRLTARTKGRVTTTQHARLMHPVPADWYEQKFD